MIPLVVYVEDQDEGGERQQYVFGKTPVRVGRGELNDLPLPRPFVSTYHALLQFDDASAQYVDLGSTNGSLVDGVDAPRNAPVPLPPGAEVLVGSYRLTFDRRVTSERLAVPTRMTLFAMRESSVLSAGPGQAPSAPPPPAPARPPQDAAAAVVPAPVRGPLDEAARAAADAAVEMASLDLGLDYASYRGAWEHLRATVDAALAGLDGAARGHALEELAARYPALAYEPEFAALRGPGAAPAGGAPPALPPPIAAPGDLASAALQLLAEFNATYVGEARLDTPHDVEAALARVAAVLEAFGRSFIELLRGYAEFGNEMGVRVVHPEGALHQRARDVRQLLAYLLDLRAEGRERELQRAFADFMLHQVALLRGVAEGGRALLDRLSPDAVSESAPKGVWPVRSAALWKEYEARFHELADEERAVSDVLFGAEFARAYAAIAGKPGHDQGDAAEGAGRDGDGDAEEEEEEDAAAAPARRPRPR